MMKKNLWIWALATFSMVACTSEDGPTPEQIVTENDWISPDGQVVVQLSADGVSVPTANVGRAIGPVEGTDVSQLDDLGIFALAENANYTSETNSPVLLYNVIAKGTNDPTIDSDLHKDDENQSLKRIRLYTSEENKNEGKTAIYYYPVTATYNYNFYGYHPYQKNTSVNKSADDVKVTFTMNQGNIDLITGRSAEAPTIADNTLYVEEKDGAAVKGNGTDKWDGYNARYIRKIKYSNELVEKHSEQATTDGIEAKKYVPNIHFKHRTTQLRFFIVANDKQSTADKEETKKLRVKDVKLLNVPTQAIWSLTTDEVNWSGDNGSELGMSAKNDKESSVWDEKGIIPAAEINNLTTQQAGYLMVAPCDSYELQLTIVAPENAGDTVPTEEETKITIKMTDEDGGNVSFEEGKYYNIYIQLNALQEVNIHAELEDWEAGDDVYIPVE